MGSLRLEEVAVQAILAKLQQSPGGWADRINQINAEKSDGVVCSPPVDYFIGRMSQIPHTSACFVLAGNTSFREEGPHSILTTMEINIWIVESDQTGPRLATRLMRQERALIECLYDDDPKEAAYVAGSNTVIGPYRLFPMRRVPGAVFQPSGQESWRGSVLIVFKAEQEEI